ncbi:non-ribosomal peptide synthetase [Sinanaerobacter sp. ZZT-01]|uniref:non-ribosomal peptide synthetase n=1 Tax=Sinanaerobacter sp. ZZT-01 TaxID=3111540 RepID=UPI002D770408|nr:non-ribosomal peptide synthetase [Sinanaerobacter sp. ZZT-01]WRR94942.1 amino acid adenylation domain-containing protein [Sinanaerobacter sp. ZZT-01]
MKSMEMSFPNLREMIQYQCVNSGKKIIFIDQNGTNVLNYRQLGRCICKISELLMQKGIHKGERVILQMNKKQHVFITILSLIYMGAIPILLPVCINEVQYRQFKRISEQNPAFHILCDKSGEKYLNFYSGDSPASIVLEDNEFEAEDTRGKSIFKQYDDLSVVTDEAAVLYSSGSTSDPKGIVWTHNSVLSILSATAQEYKVTSEDIFMAWYPLEHTLGLTYFMLLPIFMGCEIVHLDKEAFAENPKSWFDAIEKYKATISSAPNFAFQRMSKLITMQDSWRLDSIRLMLNSGEPISHEVTEQFSLKTKRFGLSADRMVPMYGLTEASGTPITNTQGWCPQISARQLKVGIEFNESALELLLKDIVCQGKPISGVSMKIVDENEVELGEDTVGYIQIGGKTLSKGYLNIKNDDFFNNGWLNTGDIGFINQGLLFIIGRKKDMFFLNGRNIFLRDIEQMIQEEFGWRCAACGENIAQEGKSLIYVFIELKITEEEITEKKRKIMQRVYSKSGIRLEDVIFVSSLAMTQVGKVNKPQLLQSYRDGIQCGGKESIDCCGTEDILRQLQTIVKEDISLDTAIYDVMNDSLMMFRCLGLLNKHYHLKLGMFDLVQCNTVHDLVRRMQDKLGRENQTKAACSSALPVTLIQEAYYLGRQQVFFGGKNGTHMYMEIQHNLDESRIQETLQALIKRHEMLRAVFSENQQHIMNAEELPPFSLQTDSIEEEQRTAYLQKNREESLHSVFDPGKWPLFSVKNVKINEAEERRQLAIVDIDMLIADGMSMHILLRDFIALYKGGPLEDVPISYRRYLEQLAEIKSSSKYKEDRAFWVERASNFPPAPALPVNVKMSHSGNDTKRLERRYSSKEWSRLEAFARDASVTVSVVLCYCYLKTLEKWSGSERFAINITVFDRPFTMNGIENVVGDFTTNVLLDYTSCQDGRTDLIGRLRELRDRMYLYFDHSAFEGIELIREIAKVQEIKTESLMPIVFTSMLFDGASNFDWDCVKYSLTQTSQVSLDSQVHRQKDSYLIAWDYLIKLYPEHMIEDMFRYYCQMLESLMQKSTDRVIFPDESAVSAYNQTQEKQMGAPLDLLLQESLLKYNDNIAVIQGEKRLSYRELYEKSEHLIANIQTQGIEKGDSIVVLTRRNIQTIAVLTAMVRMGVVYIPVPAAYPQQRVQYIEKHSGAKGILDATELYQNMDETAKPQKISPCSLEDSLYVIYTSGSTGEPKGVEMTHGAVVNTLLDINKRFCITASSTAIALSALNFDLSVYDVFGMLLAGGTISLISETRDSAEIENVLKEGAVSIWNSVPALMELFLEGVTDEYINPELRLVLLSGDWISTDLPEKIRYHFPNAKTVSLGGATEAAIWSIYYPIDRVAPEWDSIPYGYPLSNQRIYVLDGSYEICPYDVPGEIYIGGVGLAKGYRNDEKKTNAAFIQANVFGRLYKTGDYGKFTRDGYVVFLGRRDGQVKIGGHRIELGEIEGQMRQIPRIKETVVLLNKRKQLVAYYTSHEAVEAQAIQESLAAFLPPYMIPKQFHHLSEMPLTANGKLDRRALSHMDVQAPEEGRGTFQGEIEPQIKEIWAANLGYDAIGPYDDYFALGGDSITAQRIRTSIQKKFGVKIPFTTIIEQGNIRSLSAVVTREIERSAVRHEEKNITAAELKNEYPMTGVQLAYYTGRNSSFELGRYNAHYYFELDMDFSASRLERSVQKLIKRHEALRTVFHKNGMQEVMQNTAKYKVEAVDAGLWSESRIEEEALKIREQLSHKTYDHGKWPLFTFKVIEKQKSSLLFASIDLMVCDGDSLQILLGELAEDLRTGSLTDTLPYTYRNYLADIGKNIGTQEYSDAKEYWMNRIPDFAEFPRLPMVQKVSDCREYRIKRVKEYIPAAIWKKTKEAAKAHRVSPSALLCAIYAMVLSKWSNQTDLMINMTVFQRVPVHPDVSHIIGDFTKLVPLNLKADTKNLWEAAKKTQNQILTDLEHIAFDGTEIVRELSKRSGALGKALLPVVFTCILFDSPEDWFEQLGKLRYAISQTPQVFLDNQIIEMRGALHISWDYVEELFDEDILHSIFSDFVTAIRHAYETDMLKYDVNESIEAAWRGYNHSIQSVSPVTLHSLFEKQAQKTPDAIALIDGERGICYGEIERKSNQIAQYLIHKGVRAHSERIGILSIRCAETVISILGALKAGAAYVPIDADFPNERRKYILDDSRCSLLLEPSIYSSGVLEGFEGIPVNTQMDPYSLAYIIYTSGSTGVPKGVKISHQAACNTIIDINQKISLSESDCLIGISSICFDLSVYDMFGAFSKGARLAIVPEPRDIPAVVSLLKKNRVSIWNSVPVIYGMAVDHMQNKNLHQEIPLREILLSGDWIPLDLPLRSKCLFSDSKFMSLGGATEASIWSIYYNVTEVKKTWNSIPYGMPLMNQTMYVLDRDLELCAPGVKGDIYIGGVGLALGYQGDSVKTEKAFLVHPHWGRIYKTGDIGTYHKEGWIEFLGREDTQVKIRGFRVELGEIESALERLPEVDEAAATLYERGSTKQIIGYFVCRNHTSGDSLKIKKSLSSFLPEYMIPSQLIQLPAFPLSANGKVDKSKLPKPSETENLEENTVFTAPETNLQKQLVDIWENIFEMKHIGIEDDFYSLGGDSITLMKLIDELQMKLGILVSIDEILENVTVREVADLIEGTKA